MLIAQSHSDDSHMDATAPCMSCMWHALRSGSPSNVLHSTNLSSGVCVCVWGGGGGGGLSEEGKRGGEGRGQCFIFMRMNTLHFFFSFVIRVWRGRLFRK